MAQGTLPPQEQVLRMGMQLSEILNYLYTRPLLITFHDVKPENVMLTLYYLLTGHHYAINKRGPTQNRTFLRLPLSLRQLLLWMTESAPRDRPADMKRAWELLGRRFSP